MKQIISAVLQEKLENTPYQSERASQMTKEIADTVKLKLKGKLCGQSIHAKFFQTKHVLHRPYSLGLSAI
jgi:hypothetical protein